MMQPRPGIQAPPVAYGRPPMPGQMVRRERFCKKLLSFQII